MAEPMISTNWLMSSVARSMLRPPGGGIPAFSAGVGADLVVQRKVYSVLDSKSAWNADRKWVDRIWMSQLSRLDAQFEGVCILGVPSDSGGGIRRGAALGPRFLREKLAENPVFSQWVIQGKVVDLGDVYCHPQLLSDSWLSNEFREKCLDEMYPSLSKRDRETLPVAPLDMTQFILQETARLCPKAKFLVLGGDHSVAWPSVQVFSKRYSDLAIIQFDAHTDLLDSRLGIDICFGSWSSHAAKALASPKHLIQVGIRETGFDQKTWEQKKGIQQIWGSVCESLSPKDLAEKVVQAIGRVGSKNVFITNDIDGTDSLYASATGTPARGGLSPVHGKTLIERIAKDFNLVGADLCEVAPQLGIDQAAITSTGQVSVAYLIASIEGMLKR